MPVPISDLRSWTAPGAKDAAARTYTSVRQALSTSRHLDPFDYEVFLQGSYANATNIRGDSDVDIVAMLRSTYTSDTSLLDSAQRSIFERDRIPPSATISDFRSAVHRALVDYYGSSRVHGRNKCIRVDRNQSYVDADVVPCYEYRLYRAYYAANAASYIEGIDIHPRSGGRIINYPKEHIQNGQDKNGLCLGMYKPTVRQVKRLASHAASIGRLRQDAVPSYVLECMVYNVPVYAFVRTDEERIVRVMRFLHSLNPSVYAQTFKSCDEIHYLFRNDPGRHDPNAAKQAVDVMWEVL